MITKDQYEMDEEIMLEGMSPLTIITTNNYLKELRGSNNFNSHQYYNQYLPSDQSPQIISKTLTLKNPKKKKNIF